MMTMTVAATAAPKPRFGSWNIMLSLGMLEVIIPTIAIMPTPIHKPTKPAKVVSNRLSDSTWPMMSLGLAPIARLTPISRVRSFTVTSIMLLTPMMPDINVPKPTIQMRMWMPKNRPLKALKISDTLNELMASSSVGAMSCRCLMSCFRSSSKLVMGVSSSATMAKKRILSPKAYTCCMVVYGRITDSSMEPLMLTLSV